MVPKCSCLIRNSEIIQKGISRSDRALGDTNRAICPITSFLENPMPMLIDQSHDLTLKITRMGLRYIQCWCSSTSLCPLIDQSHLDRTRRPKVGNINVCKNEVTREDTDLLTLNHRSRKLQQVWCGASKDSAGRSK